MSTVYLGKANGNETETKTEEPGILFGSLAFQALFLGAAGCEGYYSASPGYYGPTTMVTVGGHIMEEARS